MQNEAKTKTHNFSAGPSILFPGAYENAIQDIKNYKNSGLSVLEISHRSPEFMETMDDAINIVKELLNVPDTHEVLFMQGGASSQFYMIPYNFLNTKAAYVNTGTWSNKAIAEVKKIGEYVEVASSKESGFNYIPKNFSVETGLDYFHYTSNNTIYGTQFKDIPNVDCKLICDMSSDIFSKLVDVSKYDLIYAGAQKNMGPAGVTLVIVKKDILGKTKNEIPTMTNYKTHADNGSMFNTPPVFAILVSLYNLLEVKKLGGVDAMQKRAITKSTLLYNEIDNNPLFQGHSAEEDRSQMNVTFTLKDESLNAKFLDACAKENISGIKGHRSVGGFRASIYNALPIESVQVLVQIMQNFNK